MGTTLTGTTPQDTYDSLIKVTDNGPLSGTAKYLSDGLGNDSALALSTTSVGVSIASPATKLEVSDTFRVSTAGFKRYLDVSEGTVKIYASNTEPSIKFGDYNTGLDRVATIGFEGDYFGRGALAFTIKEQGNGTGAEAMRISPAGNVGIGTSSPTSLLSIAPANDASDTLRVFRGKDSGFEQQSAIIDVVGGNLNIKARATDLLRYISFQLSGNGGSSYTQAARIDYDGLKFGSDTAAANALDDYEEGTWTMGISFGGGTTGVTYGAVTGTYTKIGRQVTVNGLLSITNKGTSTGYAEITGLPFTIASTNGNYSGASISLFNVSFADQFFAYGNVSTTTIAIEEISSAGVVSDITDADFANNSSLVISMTYFV